VALPAGGRVEVPASAGELSSDAPLLVLQAQGGFDASSLEIDPTVSAGSGLSRDKATPRAAPPVWARELAAGVPHVRQGVTGTFDIAASDASAPTEIAVELLAPHTRVQIRQLDTRGREVTSLVASASRPVRWRATLDPVAGGSRIEMQTLRGEAQGTVATVTAKRAAARSRRNPFHLPIKTGGGNAKFSPTINWQGSPDLYFNVTSGPVSLCGDLHVSRNFAAYTVTTGWICTDASGNATKGPWTYAGQSGDEDAFAYIVWSDGTSTNTTEHIWDKTAPTVTISGNGASPAPTALSGTANDGSYGSGFSAAWPADAGGYSSSCFLYFYDSTAGWYWCSGGSYGSQFPCNPSCTISGMPSRSVTWSAGSSVLPPGYAHVSGHCYQWGVYVYDNSILGKGGTASLSFCVP
jgi:hypothetical protein